MNNFDPTSRRPEPTRLVLLNQVQQQEPGTKIRVLGCVYAYHTESATLVLKLDYPSSRSSQTATILATIDNVLDAVNHDLLQVGSWLNIVGYVQKSKKVSSRKRHKGFVVITTPLVDVLLIWSAGAVKLDDYQSAVRSYQQTMTMPEVRSMESS